MIQKYSISESLWKPIPGLALQGLGAQKIRLPDKRRFYPKRNDALKHETGIWSG